MMQKRFREMLEKRKTFFTQQKRDTENVSIFRVLKWERNWNALQVPQNANSLFLISEIQELRKSGDKVEIKEWITTGAVPIVQHN